MARASGRRPTAPAAAVRSALAAHGLGPPACDAVVGWVRRLVALTRATDLEHGVAFDAESGRRIGSHAVGERSAIELGTLLGAMQRDRAYALVHTHPSDGPFSARDVLLLFLRPEVRVRVIVGAPGTVYVMSRGPSWSRPRRRPQSRPLSPVRKIMSQTPTHLAD